MVRMSCRKEKSQILRLLKRFDYDYEDFENDEKDGVVFYEPLVKEPRRFKYSEIRPCLEVIRRQNVINVEVNERSLRDRNNLDENEQTTLLRQIEIAQMKIREIDELNSLIKKCCRIWGKFGIGGTVEYSRPIKRIKSKDLLQRIFHKVEYTVAEGLTFVSKTPQGDVREDPHEAARRIQSVAIGQKYFEYDDGLLIEIKTIATAFDWAERNGKLLLRHPITEKPKERRLKELSVKEAVSLVLDMQKKNVRISQISASTKVADKYFVRGRKKRYGGSDLSKAVSTHNYQNTN